MKTEWKHTQVKQLAAKASAELLLDALQTGAARFEPSTGEFCCGGLKYWAKGRDWKNIVKFIGRDRILSAIAKATER